MQSISCVSSIYLKDFRIFFPLHWYFDLSPGGIHIQAFLSSSLWTIIGPCSLKNCLAVAWENCNILKFYFNIYLISFFHLFILSLSSVHVFKYLLDMPLMTLLWESSLLYYKSLICFFPSSHFILCPIHLFPFLEKKNTCLL